MTDKELIEAIQECAQLYKKQLIGQTVLFIFEDRNERNKKYKIKFVETRYQTTNFAHLTGNNSKVSSTYFYQRALTKILTTKDLTIKNRYIAESKLKVLRTLMNIDTSARAIGSYDGTIKDKLYTELVVGNVRYCLGYVLDKETNYYYTPNTALDEDIRNNRILAIMKKPRKEKQYSEITYIAKDTNIKEIFNNKKLSSLVDFKNIYFYNKANLVNTKLVDNLKKSMKKETNSKPHD